MRAVGAVRAVGRTRARQRALSRKVPLSIAYTAPAPVSAISSPARAGPSSWARASATLRVAFARCGSAATSGTIPFTPGRNIATAAPATAAMVTSSQNGGRPAKNAAASTPWVSTRTRSAATIVRRAPIRSVSTPPNSTRSTNVPVQVPRTRPAPETPYSAPTASAAATGIIASPSRETARAVK